MRDRRLVQGLLIVCGLAASAGGAAASPPAGSPPAGSLPARQAGMWRSSTVVILPDGTKARGGAPVVTVSCVDPATDLKFFTVGSSQCSLFNISGAGARYSIDSNCTQTGKPVMIHETLEFQDAATVKIGGTVDSGTGPIRLDGELKFIGPCLAGMAPGDEGDIENGQFVKTDNVTDPGNQ